MDLLISSSLWHPNRLQTKAAIKNGAVPYNEVIEWIISVGPYFIIRRFGPFTQAELDTRGHRPNDSGDADVADK